MNIHMNNISENFQINHLAQAENLLDEGKTQEAIQIYQNLLQHNPPNADQVCYQLGEALCAAEQWEPAAEAYLKALQINPKLAVASLAFGDAAVALKAYPEAEKAYKHALDTDQSLAPQLAYSFQHFADNLLSDKQYETAYRAYENSLGLNKEIAEDILHSLKEMLPILEENNQIKLLDRIKPRVEEIKNDIATRMSKKQEQDNQLLLLKLHETQENLELLFFKYNEFEEEIKQLTAERDQQVEKVAEHQNQLNQLISEHQKQVEKIISEHAQKTLETEKKLKQVTIERDQQAQLAIEKEKQQKQAITEREQQTLEKEKQLKQVIIERDQQTKLAAELQNQLKQLTIEYEQQAKQVTEQQGSLKKYIGRIERAEEKNTKLNQRQQLLDEEFIRAEAQIELIKDILIKEKAF